MKKTVLTLSFAFAISASIGGVSFAYENGPNPTKVVKYAKIDDGPNPTRVTALDDGPNPTMPARTIAKGDYSIQRTLDDGPNPT
ncbi:hypothetical protein [Fictibacillus barbaricus]|uniref:Anti-sigma regulatory factor (Ser/Thr protein kinase) n=1 Tax=Fictibacillus barbaricus TaxID=182136 RepID=A0ABU1U620_9BACL|nr:hypothetical protein [Fictibacillus barbaricus]MDR7074912.1 anti-sigma regulatory factor (Ser/Thr protein kinase) [Fictibacillus barbaricus]